MVSNARDDFPEPLSPVITVRVLRGISTSIFFRLCWRAPCTVIRSSIRNISGKSAGEILNSIVSRVELSAQLGYKIVQRDALCDLPGTAAACAPHFQRTAAVCGCLRVREMQNAQARA